MDTELVKIYPSDECPCPPVSKSNTRHGVNMDKPWHGLHWQLVHALLDRTVHNIGQDYNWCIKQPQSSFLSPVYVDWTFNSEVELDNIKIVDPVPGQIWGLWAGDLLPRCHWIFFWTDASLVLWIGEVSTVFGFSELYKKPNVTALRVTIVQSLVLTGIIGSNEEPRDWCSVWARATCTSSLCITSLISCFSFEN